MVTLGAGIAIVAGGATVAAAGTATAFGAQVTEKVLEKVDLEKVQQAVDRDRAQCERVSQLWKEFENDCSEVSTIIALADPQEDSDVTSLQSLLQVALQEGVSIVTLIAETFTYSAMNDGALTDHDCKRLCVDLCDMAQRMIGNPQTVYGVVSKILNNLRKVGGTLAFFLISGVFVGSLLVFFITLIDMHKGSPSKIAKDLRETSQKLQNELYKWLDAFGNPRS